jgi:tetratricopeptide (TPR) repeat protein
LTGARPFDGTADEVIRRVLSEAPRPPRQLNPAIPRDLQVVCLKALAKEPQQRYATANDLANDLHRVVRGEPIEARPAGFVERLKLWCRREPRLAAASAAAIVLFFALGCGAAYWTWSIDQARHQAHQGLRGMELLAVLLAQMIDANDPLGFHAPGQAGPQLAGFAFGHEGETAAKQGEALDDLAGALDGRLLDRPQARARLLEALANGYRGLGRAADARPLLLEAIALRQRIPDERARQRAVADAQFLLAWVELEQGDGERARSLFEEVAAARSLWFGDAQHADVIAARAGVLAAMMADEGSGSDMLREGWRLLAALRVGGSDSRILAALHAYPDIHAQGQRASLADYDELLANARSILGEEHPVLAILLIDAAGMHRQAGDYGQAERWIGQALPMARRFFGAHPRLLAPLREFADASAERGDFEQALGAYRDALRIADRRQPEDRPLRAEILLRIGEVHLENGEAPRAAERLAEAIELLGPATDGADESSLRDALLLRLGTAHLRRGQNDVARPYATELMQRMEGGSHAGTGGAGPVPSGRMLALAGLLRALGNDLDADRLEHRALRAALEQHRDLSPLDPAELTEAAGVLARHRQWAAAVEMQERALAGERSRPSSQPAIARRCRELAVVMIDAARHLPADDSPRAELLTRAQQLLTEALEIRRRSHGMESHYLAELLLDHARLQLAWGHHAQARAEALRALEHHRRLHDGPHILTARAMQAVSELLAQAGDAAESQRLATAAHDVRQVLLSSDQGER